MPGKMASWMMARTLGFVNILVHTDVWQRCMTEGGDGSTEVDRSGPQCRDKIVNRSIPGPEVVPKRTDSVRLDRGAKVLIRPKCSP